MDIDYIFGLSKYWKGKVMENLISLPWESEKDLFSFHFNSVNQVKPNKIWLIQPWGKVTYSEEKCYTRKQFEILYH